MFTGVSKPPFFFPKLKKYKRTTKRTTRKISEMDIKISIVLKDKTYGFSDLLDGRKLNNQTKQEIIELLKEDVGYVFDHKIEVEEELKDSSVVSDDFIKGWDARERQLRDNGWLKDDYDVYGSGYSSDELIKYSKK